MRMKDTLAERLKKLALGEVELVALDTFRAAFGHEVERAKVDASRFAEAVGCSVRFIGSDNYYAAFTKRRVRDAVPPHRT